MRQLVLDLAAQRAPSFDDFVVGSNAEAVAALRAAAGGDRRFRSVYLWGTPGAGKSHLLRSAVTAARIGGGLAQLWDALAPDAATALPDGAPGLVALDHVDQADAAGAAVAVAAYIRARERDAVVIAAGARPPLQMELRADLRSRLGSGPVFEVRALTDEEKQEALAAEARRRGIPLGGDVLRFLMTRGPRDLRLLFAILAELDRLSLAEHRPITLPRLRAWWDAVPQAPGRSE